MNYKNYLAISIMAFAFILLASQNSLAQTVCHTSPRAGKSLMTKSTGFSSDPNVEYCIPVNVFSFADGLGNFESIVEIQQGLDYLLADFEPMNIRLKIGCINEINDPVVPAQMILNTPMQTYLEANYTHPNAVTIFVFGPNHSSTYGFTGGFALGAGLGQYIFMGGNYYQEPSVRAVSSHIMSHEMGHIFGLDHTFTGASSSNTSGSFCHELADGSNCTECGDQICQTPASYGIAYTNLPGCGEPTAEHDLNGDLYTPIVTNLMDYTTSSCMGSFVMGDGDEHYSQESRMEFFLENDPWLSSITPFSLPSIINVCDGNFQALCGPEDPIFDYEYFWYFSDPVTQTAIPITGKKVGRCFTPNQYGSYILVITDQYGCSSSYYTTLVEANGPAVHIDDVYYCESKGTPFDDSPPSFVGLPGAYSDALSYTWTYDDWSGSGAIVQSGYTDHQMPYIGDGEYCIEINWSMENVPTLLGCSSTACFDVKECCRPNVRFQMDWVPFGSMSTITVQNNPLNTGMYDQEEFVLYEDCDGTGWVLSAIPSVIRISNYNDPVVFEDLDEACEYKVIHRVSSNCLEQSFVYQSSTSGFLISMYPNPVSLNSSLRIEMLSESEVSTVEISNMFTGQLRYNGVLEFGTPLIINPQELSSGQFHVRVYNNSSMENEILIIE